MKIKAFTMLELMMALLVISIILAAMAPILVNNNKNKAEKIVVENAQPVSSMPVGMIGVWYGTNYPSDWLPCNGQQISEPIYEKLRTALGQDFLPNLNEGVLSGTSGSTSTYWVIKAK